TFDRVFPVLPPDQGLHPYTRLIVPSYSPEGNEAAPTYPVFADEIRVGTDPSAAVVDLNTYDGPIDPSDLVYSTYGVNARGFGIHSVFVGSTGSAVANNTHSVTSGPQLAFGSGNRDVLAAVVDQLNLADGVPAGLASALMPADDVTAGAYAACTDAQNPSSCGPVPQCSDDKAIPAAVATLAPKQCAPSGPQTSQQWPFLSASCTFPAPVGYFATQQQDGFNQTFYAADGTPGQAPVPNSAGLATARVDCNPATAAGGAQGYSQLQTFKVGGTSGAPTVSVGRAGTRSQVSPPATAGAAFAATTSTARGIEITIPGQGGISIGSVTHTAGAWAAGRPGTAATADKVEIADVALLNADGTTSQLLCSGVCKNDQSVADAINNAFPALIKVTVPCPDEPFGEVITSKDGPKVDANARCAPPAGSQGAPAGSPGGYQAVLQAEIRDRFSDHQFNGMRPEEAAYLPGMRVQVYDDGANGLSREVLDLAGVQDDAQLGISDFGPAPAGTPSGGKVKACPGGIVVPVSATCPSLHVPPKPVYKPAVTGPVLPRPVALKPKATPAAATVTAPVVVVIPPRAGRPGRPGRPAIPPTMGHLVVHHIIRHLRLAAAHLPTNGPLGAGGRGLVAAGNALGNGVNVLEKIFAGFGIHMRTLKALAGVFAFLIVLTLPLVLMARRQLWLGNLEEFSR
ncbi:MAG: hypothetical protein ACYDGR_06685, partial [Candidatus Dormibacteria bacterium]